MAVRNLLFYTNKSVCALVFACVVACVCWMALGEETYGLNDNPSELIKGNSQTGNGLHSTSPDLLKDVEDEDEEARLQRNRRSTRSEKETKRNKSRKRENRRKISISAVEKIVEGTISRQLEPLRTAFKIIRLETFSESVLRQLESLERVQSKILTEYGELRAAIGEVGRHTMDLGRQVAGLDERLAALDRQLPHRMDVLSGRSDFLGDGSTLSGMLQMTDTVKNAMLSVTNRITAAERRFREDLSGMENKTMEATASNQAYLGRRLTAIAMDTESILNSIEHLSNKSACGPPSKSSIKEPRNSSFFPRSFNSPSEGKVTSRNDLVYLPIDDRLGNLDHLEREERQHPPSITPFNNWNPPATEVQTFNLATVQKLASEIAKHIGSEGQSKFRPRDCQDVADHDQQRSGVHTIYPASCTRRFAVEVWCEVEATGEGWTVLQKRGPWNKSPRSSSLGLPAYSEPPSSIPSSMTPVDFFRDWADYKWGFGDLEGEYWLGNEYMHQLTQSGDYKLRIEMQDWGTELKWAEYDHFSLGDEEHNYTLHIGDYTGNAGNSLKHHQGASFSTKDRDNDSNPRGHCARTFHGAWWFTSCHESHLNGRYHKGRHKSFGDGINWLAFRGHNYSLKKSRMMIRPTRSKA